MLFYAARAHDFGIGADGYFPEVEKSGTREAGILRAFAFFQEIAPHVAVLGAADYFDDLAAFQLHFHLRKSFGEVTGGSSHDAGGIFLGNDRRHRMAEQMAVARRRRKAVARAVIILVPIRPSDIGSLGVSKARPSATAILRDRLPSFFVDPQMNLERIGRRALQKMLGAQPRYLLVAKIGFGDRSAFAMDQQIVAAAQGEVFDIRHPLPAPRIFVPGLAAHDYFYLVGIIENSIWIAH